MNQEDRPFDFMLGAFIGVLITILFISSGCNFTQLPRTPKDGWPPPRVWFENDADGRRFVSVRNNVDRPIMVSLWCEHRDIHGILVPGKGVTEYYVTGNARCQLQSWKVVE